MLSAASDRDIFTLFFRSASAWRELKMSNRRRICRRVYERYPCLLYTSFAAASVSAPGAQLSAAAASAAETAPAVVSSAQMPASAAEAKPLSLIHIFFGRLRAQPQGLSAQEAADNGYHVHHVLQRWHDTVLPVEMCIRDRCYNNFYG